MGGDMEGWLQWLGLAAAFSSPFVAYLGLRITNKKWRAERAVTLKEDEKNEVVRNLERASAAFEMYQKLLDEINELRVQDRENWLAERAQLQAEVQQANKDRKRLQARIDQLEDEVRDLKRRMGLAEG